MTLDSRSTAILSKLIDASSYVPIHELMEDFNVSRRTIYYDIDKINDWLEEQGLDKIYHVRSAGIILSDKAKAAIPHRLKEIKPWYYEYSSDERKTWIILYVTLGNGPFFIKDFIPKLQVSRNTIIQDLKSLKDELTPFQLQLDFDREKGYFLSGDEAQIRKVIPYFLNKVITPHDREAFKRFIHIQVKMSNNKNLLNIIQNLKTLTELVKASERQLDLEFTDHMIYSLTLRLFIICRRVKLGHYIEMNAIEKDIIENTKAYRVANFICEHLQQTQQIDFPKEEKLFITTNLLGAKINHIQVDFQNKQILEQLRKIAEAMIIKFQRYACVLFSNKEALINNLLLHLKPTYYRVKYDIEIDHHYVETIKENYEEIFTITKKVIQPFERFLKKPIPENEIAYIAIHFGGWLQKEGVTHIPRKKALVVCANGIGTSQILKQQLEELFPYVDFIDTVSVREYEEKQFDIDFVVSTTTTVRKDHPTFIVNPILTDTEKTRLLNNVNALCNYTQQQQITINGLLQLIEQHAQIHDKEKLANELKQYLFPATTKIVETVKPNLYNLLKKETIRIARSVDDWREAIKLAAQPLLDSQHITQNYVKKMIQNVEQHGPYIVVAPKIAIAHAKPEDGALKLGMSMLKIDQAVAFSHQSKHQVHIILVLATVDNKSHLKALSQLIRLFANRKNIKRLIEFQSAKEVYHFLKTACAW